MSDEKQAEAGIPPSYGATNPEDIRVEDPPTYTQSAEAVPPSYAQSGDAPPSYDTIFGKVKSVKKDSSGCVDFLKKLIILLLGTIGCTIIIAIVLAIPVSMIIMGSIKLHDCPAERYIPIYLIVGGVFGVLKNLGGIGQRAKNKVNEEDPDDNAKTNPVDAILNCFLFAWFIAGNVWIYRTHGEYQSHNATLSTYCDETLYQYAFWLTTSMYIFCGAMCCCVCCAGIVAAICGD